MSRNGVQDYTTGTVGYWTARASNSCVVHFASSIHGYSQDFTDVDDAVDGYYQALQNFSTTYTYAQWDARINDGSSFMLRRLTPIVRLGDLDSVRLLKCRINCIDATGDATPFPGVDVGAWQPNWCRPKIIINGQPILFGDPSQMFWPTHKGDQSMGVYEFPVCIEGDYQCRPKEGRINDIGVMCAAGRIIGSDTVQQYPVRATLEFVLEDT
jgi:hypothetical protein